MQNPIQFDNGNLLTFDGGVWSAVNDFLFASCPCDGNFEADPRLEPETPEGVPNSKRELLPGYQNARKQK